MECAVCRGPIVPKATGRPAIVCSERCRRDHRAQQARDRRAGVRVAEDGATVTETVPERVVAAGITLADFFDSDYLPMLELDGELHVRMQLTPATRDRPACLVPRLKTQASERDVPMFPAVNAGPWELLFPRARAGRGREMIPCSSRGQAVPFRANVSCAVEEAAAAAGLERCTPHVLHACSPPSRAVAEWTRLRPRRSPGIPPPYGPATTRIRSDASSARRLAAGCSNTASAVQAEAG